MITKCTVLLPRTVDARGAIGAPRVATYAINVEALVEWREGIDWIRGWHDVESEDVRAMIAANMLATSLEPRK